MKLLALLAALAACGSAKPSPPPPPPPLANVDFGALRAQCGIEADSDPATQPIKDLAACASYLEAAFDRLAAANHDITKVRGILSPALDIAEALCTQESAQQQLKGLGCRYRAIWAQTAIWTGNADASRIRMSDTYLEMACTQGDAESCEIRKAKKDRRGRTWKLDGAGAEE
jgi:hypothetical protein